ncbi:hypothetical protein ACNFBR_16375 [Pseudomonas sp. NY11955]|uniref:hypothetical protein n=1 Tax=Pseudomonas sp. NY11955 TaxID=3400363 RepID=UPI003A8974A8
MAYTDADFTNHLHNGESITVDGSVVTYVIAAHGELATTPPQASPLVVANIKSVPELDRKMTEAADAFQRLIAAGAVLLEREKWQTLSPASGLVLACIPGGVEGPQNANFLYGSPTFIDNPEYPGIRFGVDDSGMKTYDAIKAIYDPLGKWSVYDGQWNFTRYIGDLYLLSAALASKEEVPAEQPGPADVQSEVEGTEQAYAYFDSPLPDFVDIGSDEDNDKLPDMTGFEPDTIGAAEHVWRSPGFLLADRDLELGEQVWAWVVRKQDGRIVKSVSLAANQSNRAVAQWPVQFLEAVNAAPAASDGGKLLLGGRLSDTGALEVGASDSPRTSAVESKWAVEKSALNRLWCYGNDHRLFTNAPFRTNLAIAGRLPDMALPAGESVVVQVRDRTTLHLYETHLFTPADEAELPSSAWSPALCTAINAMHGMLRAGVRADEQPCIAPAETGNALWVPQCSDLSVEVDRLAWRRHKAVGTFSPVQGATVQLMLYDRYSGAQLPGSPLVYKVGASDADAVACLGALKAALSASPLGKYLQLAGLDTVDSIPGAATDWALWVVSLPVRVVVLGVPGLAGDYEKALETPAGEALTLGTVYADYPNGLSLALLDRWTGHEVASWSFRLQADADSSLAAWARALDECLAASGESAASLIGWGQASVQRTTLKDVSDDLSGWTLWLPRDLECQLATGPLAPEAKVKEAPPRIGKYLTSLRNSMVVDEAFSYVDARKGGWGSAKLLAWEGDALSTEDVVRLHSFLEEYNYRSSYGRGDSGSYWNGPGSRGFMELGFRVGSANISALLASRITRPDIIIPRKDSWIFQLQAPYWAEGIQCSDRRMNLRVVRCGRTKLAVLKVLGIIDYYRFLFAEGKLSQPLQRVEFFDRCFEFFPGCSLCEVLNVFKKVGIFVGVSNELIALANFSVVSRSIGFGFSKLEYYASDYYQYSLRDGSLRENYSIVSVALSELERLEKDGDMGGALGESVNLAKKVFGRGEWLFHEVATYIVNGETYCSRSIISVKKLWVDSIRSDERCYSRYPVISVWVMMCASEAFRKEISRYSTGSTGDRTLKLLEVVVERMENYIGGYIDGSILEDPGFRRELEDALIIPELKVDKDTLITNDLRAFVMRDSCCVQLTLSPQAIDKSIRFLFYTSDLIGDMVRDLSINEMSSKKLRHSGGVNFHIPDGVQFDNDFPLSSASYIDEAGIVAACYLRDYLRDVDQACALCVYPLINGTAFLPPDTLCADYAQTVASEVYDISGASENGVDPRTGLFHAHYPVGVIRGLNGKGPELDLTLHYSPTRANESALGDGWAFRFSAYDNCLHRLTLSTGQTITLKAEHIGIAASTRRLLINGVCLTGAKGSYAALTELTVIYPSGRQERLAKPDRHDGLEANASYKQTLTTKLDKIKSNLEQWLKEVGVTDEQKKAINEKITNIAALRKDMSRKAFVLVPNSITSPQGGTLSLAWESLRGHVRLLAIRDGATDLLTGQHGEPVAVGEYNTTFTVWPGSDEQYRVDLQIKDCLLMRLSRQGKDAPAPVQVVKFGYEGEPVLDRVLCFIAEEDGSLEQVNYAPAWKNWDTSNTVIPLSRVIQHTLVPGAGQQTVSHRWQFEGLDNLAMQEGDRIVATEMLDDGSGLTGPFTRRTWTLKNGFSVETEIVEETPGVMRETTTHIYPDSVTSTDDTVRYRLATQPIRTVVTTEDLRTSGADDPPPTTPFESSTAENQP